MVYRYNPRLVVGAWVGGEYRCIHFRTGELGQGNRTALPICGYFLQSVLDDPQFKQYHAKFETPADISMADYSCGGYFKALADSDSIGVDSLVVEGELMQPTGRRDSLGRENADDALGGAAVPAVGQ